MRKLLATAQLLVLALLISTSVMAQNNKGAIVGTVKDPNDALVANAQVKVTSVKTGEVRTAETTEDGTFTVTNLEPGRYTVLVEGSGFQSVTFEAVDVETNARLPLDVKFVVGQTGASVTVSAESAPLIESETSVRGDIITGRQVTDLPIPQRNFTLLAGLSPGVTRPNLGLLGGGGNFVAGGGGQNNTESTRFRESGGSVLVINGARATNNNFTLDGVDNNESQFG
ncbi:MAG TPA: carboxypeptidase-like regulatory domain-containing protein, partial [Pyrinomonadaceae bacterium]|nr:carboxypeptidase-like regulatory domain-containing protein [Pyrinomonadaceae bacterium]